MLLIRMAACLQLSLSSFSLVHRWLSTALCLALTLRGVIGSTIDWPLSMGWDESHLPVIPSYQNKSERGWSS